MPDQQDWIVEAMTDLAKEGLPPIAPPGVAAVGRSVRRRRRLRMGVVAAVALAGLLAVGPLVSTRQGAGPVAPPVTTAAAPAASPAKPSPTVAPTGPAATATSAPQPAVVQPGGGQKSKAPPPPNCAVNGRVTLKDVGNSQATAYLETNASADQILCPGGSARVFWATYTVDADGVLHLYRSQEYILTWQNPEVRMRLQNPQLEPCMGYAYYYVAGRQPVVTSVKVTDPRDPSAPPYPFVNGGTGRISWNLTPACPSS